MPPLSATWPIRPSKASISRTRWPLPRPPMAGLQDMAPMVANWWVTRAVCAPMRADAAAASQPAWPPPITTTSNCRRLHLAPRMRACSGGAGRGSKTTAFCGNVSRETSPKWVARIPENGCSGPELAFRQNHNRAIPRVRPELLFWQIPRRLFADAEVAENHVQNILDIDPAGQTAQGTGREPQLLGQQILTAGDLAAWARRRAARTSSSAWRWRTLVTSADSAPARNSSAWRASGPKAVKTLACDG